MLINQLVILSLLSNLCFYGILNYMQLKEGVMYHPLNQQEKRDFIRKFNLSALTSDEQKDLRDILLNYLNEFPILNGLARQAINTGWLPITVEIKPLKDCAGCQSSSRIDMDRKFWDRMSKNPSHKKRVASIFWHELLHYLQNDELSASLSKRGHIVYRQFIEAEAESITNLIYPQSRFEKELYLNANNKFSDPIEAQKYYLGVSTRLRLHADRELAKHEAKIIMGKDFLDSDWRYAERDNMKHWRDYYYQYHASHIDDISYKGLLTSKSFLDKRAIKKIEDYFFNKYGMKIYPKSSISPEIIKKYDMTQGIENTILFDTRNNDMFDFSKWQTVRMDDGKKAYVLELPDMDKNYMLSLKEKFLSKGVSVYEEVARHSDGRANWCLAILDDGSKNVNRFLSLCGIRSEKEVSSETEKTLPPMPPHPQKQVYLKKGMVTEINPYNPPILKVGKEKTITFDLQSILTQKRIDFLRSGGIMLLGRNPISKYAKIPPEVQNYQGQVKAYLINDADTSVSNAQGYLYMARDGKVYYKDCSTFGTHLFLRSEKTKNRQFAYER